MPGQKAMEGLFPVCIEVEAEVTNPKEKETLKDVSIYGKSRLFRIANCTRSVY